MTNNDLEKLFKTCATALDDVVAEAIGEDLARQGWNGYPGALALEDVAEVLKVRVAAANTALAQLECRYVCAAKNLVICIHVAAHTVRSWVTDLYSALCKPLSLSLYVCVCVYDSLGPATERKEGG
jgi:hypothetical protein